MSIGSVDLQIIIPRSTEVGKNQHVADHQSTLQQQQFAEQWQKVSHERQQQVQSTPKDEGGKVQRENQQEKQKRHESQQDEHEKLTQADAVIQAVNQASGEDPVRGHLIDIKT
jgi:FKBP-type peptidyl-prolyl cis-trans isomerase